MATTSRDFEFDRIEAFVKRHGATVLALQFPAHLLGAAPAVATALAARLGAAPEIYVLGDPVPRGAVDCVGAAHRRRGRPRQVRRGLPDAAARRRAARPCSCAGPRRPWTWPASRGT